MKFGAQLEAMMVPEWQPYYLNYKALKRKLKQAKAAQAEAVDYLASSPQTTSLSILRSLHLVSPTKASRLQQLQQYDDQEQQEGQPQENLQQQQPEQQQQAVQLPWQQEQQLQHAQQQQQQQQLKQLLQQPVGERQQLQWQENSVLPKAYQSHATSFSMMSEGRAEEQFLQMLQQDLAQVHDFIHERASALIAALQSVAAAAPQMAFQDWQGLEQRARDLGKQLLALEGFMQLNQAGFVEIVKTHDKLLPEMPVWHLYLHHLQKMPWMEESKRQFMWAALSSCYYHLHASLLRQKQQQMGLQPRQQQLVISTAASATAPTPRGAHGAACSTKPQQSQGSVAAAGSASAVGGRPPTTPRTPRSRAGSVAGLLPALGSAVVGAASAVAGAATAVAEAAAAAITPPVAAGDIASPFNSSALNGTRKYWVALDDVSAVMYQVLQHLPLLPSTAHTNFSQSAQQTAFGTTVNQTTKQPQQQQSVPMEQQQGLIVGQPPLGQPPLRQQQHRRRTGLQEVSGFVTPLHTVYFDNAPLELYHGRLYMRPNTQTLKARWIGQFERLQSSLAWVPSRVVIERKIYKEGWKGEPNIKDGLLIAGDKLPAYFAGSYSLGHALAQLYKVPDGGPGSGSNSLQSQQQQPEQQQTPLPAFTAGSSWSESLQQQGLPEQQQLQQQSPARKPLQASAQSLQSLPMQKAAAASGNVTADAAVAEPSSQATAAVHHMQPHLPSAFIASLAAGASSAPAKQDTADDGFEDAYLDPPMPSADQLSLFTEFQRLVQLKGLKPALQCVVHRMVFAMPFDDRIKVTLDTNVAMMVPHPEGQPLVGIQPLSGTSSLPALGSAAAFPAGAAATATMGVQGPAAVSVVPQQEGTEASSVSVMFQQHGNAVQPAAATAVSGRQRSAVSWMSDVPNTSSLLHAATSWLDVHHSSSSNLNGRPLAAAAAAAAGHTKLPTSLSDLEQQLAASWKGIFAADPYHHVAAADGGGGLADVCSPSGSTYAHAVVYGMPYALLKVSINLPAGQSPPGWLLQLMESEKLIRVEDWSKFVHGCAVLQPDRVRAVPYWIDDLMIDRSVQAIQAELKAYEASRSAKQAAAATVGSAGLAPAVPGGSSLLDSGRPMPQSASSASVNKAAISGSGTAARHAGQPAELTRRLWCSGGSTAAATASLLSSTSNLLPAGSHTIAKVPSSSIPQAALVQAHLDCSNGLQHQPANVAPCMADTGPAAAAFGGNLPALKSSGSPGSLTAGGRSFARRLSSFMHRQPQQQPLFRSEGRSPPTGWRKRWGHPVQLLECREFLYSEAIFLDWLRLAITMASAAVLLLGYSAMAYINPVKLSRFPVFHLAEIVSLLMLPSSCVMVAYAIRVFIWRGKRLHSMRYRRVDDQVGPILMAAVFVAAMVAVFLVNVADLLLLLKFKAKHADAGGDEQQLQHLQTPVLYALAETIYYGL